MNSTKFSKKDSCQAGFLHLGTPVYRMLCHPLAAVFSLFMWFSGAPQVPVTTCLSLEQAAIGTVLPLPWGTSLDCLCLPPAHQVTTMHPIPTSIGSCATRDP